MSCFYKLSSKVHLFIMLDAEYQRAKNRIISKDPFSNKNSNVDTRALKDKLELKAINAALEKKAVLYDKLAKGELSDEEDKEKYCVDFFRKDIDQDDVSPTPNVPPENEHAHANVDADVSLLFN